MASTAVPIYSNACIAPDTSSLGNAVLLVGVPQTEDGRLELHSVKLGDYSAPTATFLSNQTTLFWSNRGKLACFQVPGTAHLQNGGVLVQQFMPATSFFTTLYSNGTIAESSFFPSVGFASSKNFALTNGVGNEAFFVAQSNQTFSQTQSAWVGLLIFSLNGASSQRDFAIGSYPSASPVVSVGTFTYNANEPAAAHLVVFDTSGGGTIYHLASSLNYQLPSHLATLSTPSAVDMNGIVLTSNVFSVNMGDIGYLLDMAPDNTTLIYSITPSSSPKLIRVIATGNVPSFSTAMAATALGNKLVVYGSSGTPGAYLPTFNAFDTGLKSWSGRGLIQTTYTPPPPSETSPDKKTSIGGIVGGVGGALVVVALVAFFVIRRRRHMDRKLSAGTHKSDDEHNPNKAVMTSLMHENYTTQQQQQHQLLPNNANNDNNHAQIFSNQQEPFRPLHPLVPTSRGQSQLTQFDTQHTSLNTYSQPVSLGTELVQHQHPSTSPVIFQPPGQEPYKYTSSSFVPHETQASTTLMSSATVETRNAVPSQPERKSYIPPPVQNPQAIQDYRISNQLQPHNSPVTTNASPPNNPQAIVANASYQLPYVIGNPQALPVSHNTHFSNNGFAN
ncbi:hypothetical protein BG004_001379 [Podila humilis]|nr:hypothetical protein BG004_001379 [Podila humilis]